MTTPRLVHAARVVAIAIALVASGSLRALADDEPHAELRLEGRPHAGVAFQIDLVVDGFDDSPAPDLPRLEIPGAKITPIPPAQAQVSRSIQIASGRRVDTTRTTWVLRYRVEVEKDGNLHVPSLTATQGTRKATARAGDVPVDAVPVSDDMKVTLDLPDRPLYLGETAKATLTWMFRRDPQDRPVFVVPAMNLDELTIIAPPAADKQRTLEIEAGGKTVELPYVVDQTTVDGQKYNRLVVSFFLAPRKAGKLDLPGATVFASFPVGRPDYFGQSSSKLYRAGDVARTLEILPLPEQDKPPTFAGAVGSQFAIKVTTSRSVVQLGEPVDLTIQIKSDQALDSLALGRIDGAGGLPTDKFTVPQDAANGELSDDGLTKTFKVTAQLVGPAKEIPAIAFAYFDPKLRAYQTVRSEPIALSVKDGNVVGTDDVVGGPKRPATPVGQPGELSLVGAELALSSPSDIDARPLGGDVLWVLVGLLYLLPLAIFAARTWQLRTASGREEAAEVRTARRRVEQALATAEARPAREAAGELGVAIRGLARTLERDGSAANALLGRIETESFAPRASEAPLSRELRDDARALVTGWLDARPRARAGATTAALVLVMAGVMGGSRVAAADDQPKRAPAASVSTPSGDPLAEGRLQYQDAMTRADASAKRAAFSRAAAAFGQAAHATPGRPELLADWGNAALGAGDLATATLAYRRALALDAETPRARKNLDWLRGRQDPTFRPPALGGATDSLLFFHAWSRGRRIVVGAVAFAIAVLLVVPWRGRRARWQIGAAVAPIAVWLAMVVSVVVEDRHVDDAVVMDGVVLRAADNAGAPSAMLQPLPPGAEVTIVEQRDAWTKIRLPSGTSGWVPGGTLQRIAEP